MEPDSPPFFLTDNWVRFDSHQNQELKNNDDEALSLCNFATSKHTDPEVNHPEERFSDEHLEDFDFGGAAATLPENKMCSADELFFHGQILPLRHSVTLPSGFMTQTQIFTRSVSFSGSEPMSVISSRSNSTRSNNSGTSGSSTTAGSEFTTRTRNQFHSHPSPIPQIRTRNLRHSKPKTSSKWSFLQLGVLNPQEIGLEDLKNRSQRSHGSSSSRSNSMKDLNPKKKKKEMLLFGGCTCSENAIENTVFSRIPMVKPARLKEEETKLGVSKESDVGLRKHELSSHRTSEWLKQLSVQESAPLRFPKF